MSSEHCPKCGRTLSGKVVKALDRRWHVPCFQCFAPDCGRELLGQEFLEEDGVPYCPEHHAELFRKCAHCGRGCTQRVVTVGGRHYHTYHFLCSKCDGMMDPNDFFKRGEKMFCSGCWNKMRGGTAEERALQRRESERKVEAEREARKKEREENEAEKCGTCGRNIVRKFVTAHGVKHHTYCLKCYVCDLMVDPDDDGLPDGDQFICKRCHRKKNSESKAIASRDAQPTDASTESPGECGECGHAIRAGSKFGRAFGKVFHSYHFCCAKCECMLKDEDYKERDKKLYCVKCYEKEFCHVCLKCRKAIQGAAVRVGDSDRMHRECFKCEQCSGSLNDGYFEREGALVCERCYDALSAPCGLCHRPIIDGDLITAMGNRWHPECFTCTMCKTSLVDSKFVRYNNKPHCRPCAEADIAAKKKRQG